jgi:hypothetical protein
MSHIFNKAERLNKVTTLFGALIAIYGIVWLLTLAVLTGDP